MRFSLTPQNQERNTMGLGENNEIRGGALLLSEKDRYNPQHDNTNNLSSN